MAKKLPFKMIVETDIEKYRMDTFWTKEPETIEWINDFKSPYIFWDIGANIGIYSLYAAVTKWGNIYCFEPMINNFNALMQNIRLNKFKNIQAFPIGIMGEFGYDYLYNPSTEKGISGSQIGTIGNILSVADNYSILYHSIDELAEIMHSPNYVKIDIDGLEFQVVCGMLKTLRNNDLKSVLIEINDYPKDTILKIFDAYGFTTNNRFNKLKNHSRVRRAKEGIKVENIIFTRR